MTADSLDVRLNDHKVGTITALGGDRSIFSFDDAYADDPNRPTLSLAFKGEHGGLLREHNPTQTKLLPFFSNLLPEGSLRDYLAKRAGVKAVREYPLIEVLGPDLPGAITIKPAGAGVVGDEDDLTDDETHRPNTEKPLRFSLAGVQLKFSAVEKARGGLTIPASGKGGDWIVKLPSARFRGVAANEFSMMSLAREMGLDVPAVELVPLDKIEGLPEGIGKLEEQEAFAVRRFDRTEDGGRIHIEDFAQVFGVYPDDKYEKGTYRHIAKVLWLETGEAGIREFIKRLVFNALIGNADMHLKNWSLIYPDGRTPQLSPGYDFVSTTVYIPDDSAGLRFARTKRVAELTLDEIAYMAAKAGAPEALAVDAATEMVDRFREVWGRERAHLPIAKDLEAEVESLLNVVPLASSR